MFKKEMILEEMIRHGETFLDVEESTIPAGEIEFEVFTLWTKNRVYFPVVYDNLYWVCSVPRHPNGEYTAPVGN